MESVNLHCMCVKVYIICHIDLILLVFIFYFYSFLYFWGKRERYYVVFINIINNKIVSIILKYTDQISNGILSIPYSTRDNLFVILSLYKIFLSLPVIRIYNFYLYIVFFYVSQTKQNNLWYYR